MFKLRLGNVIPKGDNTNYYTLYDGLVKIFYSETSY